MRLNIPDASRTDLEKRFEDFFYHGVCLGHTIKSYFSVTLGVAVSSACSALAHLSWLILFGPFHKGESGGEMNSGRVLFALSADVERYNRLIFPIANCFRTEGRGFLFANVNSAERLKDKDYWCTTPWICHRGTLYSRVNFLKDLPKIVSRFNVWRKANNLPWHTVLPFAFRLAHVYVYIDGFKKFLSETKPSCIVVDYEHYSTWAALIEVARKCGVPSIALMHGEIYSSYGWTPLLADKVVVWGESQKRQLVSFGVDPARIEVCGCPRIADHITADVIEIRNRLGLSGEKPIVLLATNPILIPDRLRLVEVFGEALKGIDGVQGIIRLHPSEKLEVYESAINRFPHLKFYEAKGWSVEESIAISTLIVNHDSTFGDDALVYGKPVVEIDVLERGLTNGKKLVEKAACPCAMTSDELKAWVLKIVSNPEYGRHLVKASRPFVQDIFFAVGDAAAAESANCIKKMAS